MSEQRVPPSDADDDGVSEPDGGAAADPEPGEHDSAYELLQRGRLLMRERHNAQAAVVLERAARMEPGRASILEALGRAYFNSRQHERSRETFEALLEIDPSAHYAQFALGQSLKKLGREKEAWVHLRLAVALSPRSAMYRTALGRIPDPKLADRDAEAETVDADGGDADGDRDAGGPGAS